MARGYYTHGSKIKDGFNQDVILKGISKTGMEYSYVALETMIPEMIDFDIKKLIEWNVNVVRIPIRDLYWLTENPYQEKVIYWVDKLLSSNMVVIIDLHTQQKNPNMDDFMIRADTGLDAKKLWIDIATRYKDNDAVFFEIFNEPHNITPNIWWYGNNIYYGYKEILVEIRKIANNICLLGGLDYAYQWAFLKENPRIFKELKSFKNIVLATHPYGYRGGPKDNGTNSEQIPTEIIQVDTNYTGDCSQGISVPTIQYENFGWNASFGFLIEEDLFPVMATEWGLDRPQNCIQGGWFNNEILKYINSMNMSYTAWAWVQDRLDYPSLLDPEFNPTGRGSSQTFGPACSGVLNNFYGGPGVLVFNDLTKSNNRVLSSFPYSSSDYNNSEEIDCSIFIRNFSIIFLCLFFLFNLIFWTPFKPTRKTTDEQDTDNTQNKVLSFQHYGIRIRSSQSLQQIKTTK